MQNGKTAVTDNGVYVLVYKDVTNVMDFKHGSC